MSLLSAQQISKTFGDQVVLGGVDLHIEPQERVGLVGANGSGKSTLGRILAGVDTPDLGTVARRRGARIAYLAQEPLLRPGSARDVAAQGLEGWYTAKTRHDAISEALEHGRGDTDRLLAEQAEVSQELEHLGGWDVMHRVEDMLARLQIENLEQDVSTMSGGERRRVALAQLLISSPDLAILDEPTNHLDADTIEWLENYLIDSFEGALLLITHDRYVLDRVALRTLELERGALYSYDGGWERYLMAKAERQEHEARTESNRQNFLRSELEWLRRQPKARSTKQKARINRAEDAIAATGPTESQGMRFETATRRLGATVLELDHVKLEIGDKLLISDLELKLTQRERVGIIGRNGSGKSSLLRAIMGELAPSSGKIVVGQNTAPAYFDQGRSGLKDDENIMENVGSRADVVEVGGKPLSVYSYLERFSFRGDRIRTPVGSLSGGERARVALAKLLLKEGNLLLLDEPTNDLDVQTLASLEEMLITFKGAALVITHDRYFLNRVATCILAFEGDGKVTRYAGNFDNYLEQRQEARQRAKQEAQKPTSVPPQGKKPVKSLSSAEKKELELLMPKIEKLEVQAAELEQTLADPKTYERGGDAVRALKQESESVQAELQAAIARWEALETKKSG